mmetsp:Transcript_24463/g.52047  ORF Transcript_24463/g.52047 Transcript_24463/m.52047 type:complete len:105 (+) Transcript_24463:92-406(+)|eukprot:CAMPEP_0201129034 /NCGR_PEP_ID=MMETSP0850-20130426/35612_1 /ASSEMBLY_ACC=CAM_ASM_000622 /TAXON_ID=183588 /ORGANISM="Pseudo-nitzschia fraudulenta, Strain WWA7" /LENGTH=104 /DNA_ID=CAMNT_0047398401 /DNA_START=80 /DNA_END=394 /DNA_ORIENTATION=-
MALTLLNYFYWKIPEAKIPFMIADITIVVAMRFVEKGIAAENKLRHIEEEHAEHNQKLDKGEKLAQKKALRHQQQRMAHSNKGSGRGIGGKKTFNNIQMPMKTD